MEKKELIELLEELAVKDLAGGANLEDHPCSLAIREIKTKSPMIFSDRAFASNFLDFMCKGKGIRFVNKTGDVATEQNIRDLLIEFDEWMYT